MTFSLVESMAIDQALKCKGIDRGMGILNPNYNNFEKEQLEQIDECYVEGSADISFLKYLPNLKRVVIRSHDYSKVIGEGSYQDNEFFNQIMDFHVLRELPLLEDLWIENDLCIKVLDVRGLKNLKNVCLINNPRLETILGMDEQHHLENVMMYGNNIKHFSNVADYLNNTIDAKQNVLDISIFFTFIHSIEDAKKLYDMDLKGLIKVTFAEKNGIVKYTELSVEQIVNLYVKFRRLFEQRGITRESDFNKVGYVFRYVTEYIKFASTELQDREKLCAEILETYNEIPDFYKKNLGSLHSSFNTYHFKSGNCEGIVNLMRFMLWILHIETENVHCHDRRFRETMDLNHALLRAKCEGKWLYYDTTYDRKNSCRFFAKTYEEISVYSDLSIFERTISEEEEYETTEHHGKSYIK